MTNLTFDIEKLVSIASKNRTKIYNTENELTLEQIRSELNKVIHNIEFHNTLMKEIDGTPEKTRY